MFISSMALLYIKRNPLRGTRTSTSIQLLQIRFLVYKKKSPKGDENIWLLVYNFRCYRVYKKKSPKGDENFNINILHDFILVYKKKSPKGDENLIKLDTLILF